MLGTSGANHGGHKFVVSPFHIVFYRYVLTNYYLNNVCIMYDLESQCSSDVLLGSVDNFMVILSPRWNVCPLRSKQYFGFLLCYVRVGGENEIVFVLTRRGRSDR